MLCSGIDWRGRYTTFRIAIGLSCIPRASHFNSKERPCSRPTAFCHWEQPVPEVVGSEGSFWRSILRWWAPWCSLAGTGSALGWTARLENRLGHPKVCRRMAVSRVVDRLFWWSRLRRSILWIYRDWSSCCWMLWWFRKSGSRIAGILGMDSRCPQAARFDWSVCLGIRWICFGGFARRFWWGSRYFAWTSRCILGNLLSI